MNHCKNTKKWLNLNVSMDFFAGIFVFKLAKLRWSKRQRARKEQKGIVFIRVSLVSAKFAWNSLMTKLATYDDESLFCFRWILNRELESIGCRVGSALSTHRYITRGKTEETKPKNATQNLLSNEMRARGTYRNLCNWIHDGFCSLDFSPREIEYALCDEEIIA